jgi:SAM-dependent methyltransferase
VTDPPRRLVFGSVAERYERFRPGYPDALVDDVLAYAGLGQDGSALEVGAGTGKATRAFAARGVDVTCVEPDAAMAGVLRRVCPQARVEVTSFEDYELPDEPFALLFSGQAWHWVDEEVRWVKARRALRPGGAVAVFWNQYDLDRALQDEIDEVWRRHAPERAREQAAVRAQEPTIVDELGAAGFVDAERRSFGPSGALDASGYVNLTATTSGHLILADDVRTRVVDEIRELLEAHGGALALPSGTELFLGRVPS